MKYFEYLVMYDALFDEVFEIGGDIDCLTNAMIYLDDSSRYEFLGLL